MRSLSRMLAVVTACLWAAAAVHAQNVVSDQETVRRAIHVCASCHGEGGCSSTPRFRRWPGGSTRSRC